MCWKSQDPPKHVWTGRRGRQDSAPCPVPGAYNFSSTSPLPRNQAGPEAPTMGLGSVAGALPPAPTFLPAGPESHVQVLSSGLHDCCASLVLSLSVPLHIPRQPGSSPLLQGASLSTLSRVCISSPTTVPVLEGRVTEELSGLQKREGSRQWRGRWT